MRKYKAKECSCWSDYPNYYYGQPGRCNKCVELYRNIRQTNHISRKTKCILIEAERGDADAEKAEAKAD